MVPEDFTVQNLQKTQFYNFGYDSHFGSLRDVPYVC